MVAHFPEVQMSSWARQGEGVWPGRGSQGHGHFQALRDPGQEGGAEEPGP